MKKTDLQLQCFLSDNSYRSETDWSMISAFCKDKADFSFMVEIDPEHGLTASEFIEWYDNGYGAGDIAQTDDGVVMIGKTDCKTAVVVGTMKDEHIVDSNFRIPSASLHEATAEEMRRFRAIMLKDRQQFSWDDLTIIEKYIPHNDERILFQGNGIKGLGVVRDVDVVSGAVVLYCYYIYETKRCGYTMHETGICNLQDYSFESLESGKKHVTRMNHISCQRRLNRELERHGKVWNQARHRIEPVHMQVEVGKKYWYINDKMILKQDVEKGTPTSRNRALAGNYFPTRMLGLEILGLFNEVLRDFLASPETNP